MSCHQKNTAPGCLKLAFIFSILGYTSQVIAFFCIENLQLFFLIIY